MGITCYGIVLIYVYVVYQYIYACMYNTINIFKYTS